MPETSLITKDLEAATNPVVCKCLNVREREIVQATELYAAETWRDVRRITGAGDGCTVCHCRIRELIEQCRTRRSPSAANG